MFCRTLINSQKSLLGNYHIVIYNFNRVTSIIIFYDHAVQHRHANNHDKDVTNQVVIDVSNVSVFHHGKSKKLLIMPKIEKNLSIEVTLST